MKYDVIIIGAGPGGIFSAYELVKGNKDLKIAVFETGSPLEKRNCPIDGEKVKSCVNCKTCAIMSGFGGAGAFSDGKYNITNDFGGTLHEHIGKKEAISLMEYVDEINISHGGEGTKMYTTAGSKFRKLCLQNKLNLLNASGSGKPVCRVKGSGGVPFPSSGGSYRIAGTGIPCVLRGAVRRLR